MAEEADSATAEVVLRVGEAAEVEAKEEVGIGDEAAIRAVALQWAGDRDEQGVGDRASELRLGFAKRESQR